MNLNELGEFGLIRRFASRFTHDLPSGIEGIGDDCAIIPYREDLSLLMTTDLLIENVHFLKSKISPEDLGYKSLAVNLSDIAAMGGQPLYAFLSLGLPANIKVDWIDKFFDGLEALAKKEQVLLLGGDTTHSLHDIVINILVVGQAKTSHIKRRSQAKPGDILCCTGYVGNSGAGLKILKENLPLNPTTQGLIHDHHRPYPYIQEGKWLSQFPDVHAMIDISDGIESDIRHIMEQSHCGADIFLNQLPLSPKLCEIAHEFNWNAYEIGLTAGEDYCLLLTIDPSHYPTIASTYSQLFHHPLHPIGHITETGALNYYLNDHPVTIHSKGFDHFSAHSQKNKRNPKEQDMEDRKRQDRKAYPSGQ